MIKFSTAFSSHPRCVAYVKLRHQKRYLKVWEMTRKKLFHTALSWLK